MTGHYLNTLPRKAMRALGGYNVKHGSYWLAREQHLPQQDLLLSIFPNIEHVELSLTETASRTGSTDLAAFGFIRLLKFLRVVLLQDSVELMSKYPNNIVFKHAIFLSQSFTDFSTAHTSITASTEDPTALSLKLALPQMSEVQ
jgi:hypothetical protein